MMKFKQEMNIESFVMKAQKKTCINLFLYLSVFIYFLHSMYWYQKNKNVEYLKNAYLTIAKIAEVIPKENSLILLNTTTCEGPFTTEWSSPNWFFPNVGRCLLMPLRLSYEYNTNPLQETQGFDGDLVFDPQLIENGLSSDLDVYVINISKNGCMKPFHLRTRTIQEKILSFTSYIGIKRHIQSDVLHTKYEKFYFKIDVLKYTTFMIAPSPLNTKGFGKDHIWTLGDGRIENLSVKLTPKDKYVVLKTKGIRRFIREVPKFYLNDNEMNFAYKSDKKNEFYYHLPKTIKVINNIRIKSSTFNPKKLGINNDSRNLGVDVKGITIVR